MANFYYSGGREKISRGSACMLPAQDGGECSAKILVEVVAHLSLVTNEEVTWKQLSAAGRWSLYNATSDRWKCCAITFQWVQIIGQ